jgi:hypothetical protein
MASADEDRTLARPRKLRAELIDPTVASQNGRVFKRTGDGALVEFRSVVEAVRCVITIQNAMIERNVGISADQRIELRALARKSGPQLSKLDIDDVISERGLRDRAPRRSAPPGHVLHSYRRAETGRDRAARIA